MGMEQMYEPPGEWVSGLYLCTLEFITGMAGDAQIFPHCSAASRFGKDMVYDETCSRNRGQGVTIRTLMTSFGD